MEVEIGSMAIGGGQGRRAVERLLDHIRGPRRHLLKLGAGACENSMSLERQ